LIVRALVAAGVHSVMSFQLFTHGANTCALNLFGFAARAFDPSLQVLQVLQVLTGPDDEIRRCAGNTPFQSVQPGGVLRQLVGGSRHRRRFRTQHQAVRCSSPLLNFN
jgi:hypothetical protein